MSEQAVEVSPKCLGPQHHINPLRFVMPPGSWDTHFHVFGPTTKYPYSETRKYTPPDSPFEEYVKLMLALGIERGVCVHPNIHGPDDSVTLDAVERSEGRFLAIVKIAPDVTLPQLKEMKKKGACGVRFAFNPEHGSGELDTALFDRVVQWCGELDWCVNLHFASSAIHSLAERLSQLTIPTLIDHFGRVHPTKGVDQPDFKTLVDLMRLPHMWVKLTGADRISRNSPSYQDVVPLARTLVDVAPDRVIWGTDWPHSGYFDVKRMPNDGDLTNLLLDFAPSEEQRRRILVDNPSRLFGQVAKGA